MSDDETPDAPVQPTSLPCPPWCGREPGHGFDHDSLVQPGLLYRDHEADVGPRVWVAADEYAVGPEGPLWQQDEPRAYLEKQDGLDAAGARALAAELLRAADLIDGGQLDPERSNPSDPRGAGRSNLSDPGELR